jgi:hypothetical protein
MNVPVTSVQTPVENIPVQQPESVQAVQAVPVINKENVSADPISANVEEPKVQDSIPSQENVMHVDPQVPVTLRSNAPMA